MRCLLYTKKETYVTSRYNLCINMFIMLHLNYCVNTSLIFILNNTHDCTFSPHNHACTYTYIGFVH